MHLILQLLLMLGGSLGGRFLGGRAASAVGGQVASRLPGLAARAAAPIGKGILSKATGSEFGAGASKFLGEGLGFIGGGIAAEALTGEQGTSPEPLLPDPGIEDILRTGPTAGNVNLDQRQGLERLFQDTEILNVLASLGIDPEAFLGAAQPIV